MRKEWPRVKLQDVLDARRERVQPDPLATYKEITVRLWGKGVVERGLVPGAEISSTSRFRVRQRDFVLSKIDARNGALGIVPDSLDGALVSSDFPTYQVKQGTMRPEYLGWLCKTADFVEACRRASEGTTNRVRLKINRFLSSEIPLPPLEEQQRIVAYLDTLSAKITQARTLRQQATEEATQLMAAQERQVWPDSSLNDASVLVDVTTFLARGKQSEQGESQHFLIKTQHVQQDRYVPTMLRLAPHAAAKVKPEAVTQRGDILIACSAAGCLGRVARYEGDGKSASTDTHVAIARANPDIVVPAYLYAYLRGAQGQHQLRSRERGDWKREKVSFRLTELNLNDLRRVPVPVPNRDDQRRIVAELDALQAKVDALKRTQAETDAELAALQSAALDRAFKGDQ